MSDPVNLKIMEISLTSNTSNTRMDFYLKKLLKGNAPSSVSSYFNSKYGVGKFDLLNDLHDIKTLIPPKEDSPLDVNCDVSNTFLVYIFAHSNWKFHLQEERGNNKAPMRYAGTPTSPGPRPVPTINFDDPIFEHIGDSYDPQKNTSDFIGIHVKDIIRGNEHFFDFAILVSHSDDRKTALIIDPKVRND